MNQVIVHPERCVGCMQCTLACATAHSQSKSLFAATLEKPQPKPRIHVGKGLFDEGFPNRCRHCDPAPCMLACLPGAIFRDPKTNTVLIKPEICINCASCAMACPFGVLRYHEDPFAPPGKVVAVKCDNCLERREQGMIPACVEACKAGALTFEDSALAQKAKTDQVAQATLSQGEASLPPAPGFELQSAHKRSLKDLETR